VLRDGKLLGVVSQRSLLNADPETRIDSLIDRPPVVIGLGETARVAASKMATYDIGRLIIVDARNRDVPIGIITQSDLIRGFARPI